MITLVDSFIQQNAISGSYIHRVFAFTVQSVWVLKDKQVNHIFVKFRMLEYSARPLKIPFVDELYPVVGVRLQNLHQMLRFNVFRLTL